MARAKGERSWQRLLQFIGAHMHEEVADDRLDRALKTASGGLARNPSYVIDQFVVEIGGRAEAGAISPKGTIAVVLAEYRGREGAAIAKSFHLLTRFSDGRRQLRPLGEASSWLDVRVFFAEGSEEPVVVVDDVYVKWGMLQLTLPKAVTHLTFWSVGEHERHVAYIKGHVAHHQVASGHAIEFEATDNLLKTCGHTRWLGLVGGSLCRITVDGDRETLHWRDRMLPVSGIDPSTICFVKNGHRNTDHSFMPDHLQFVAGDCAYYWSGGTPFDAEVPQGMRIVECGRILVVSTDRPCLLEFTPRGRFEERMKLDLVNVRPFHRCQIFFLPNDVIFTYTPLSLDSREVPSPEMLALAEKEGMFIHVHDDESFQRHAVFHGRLFLHRSYTENDHRAWCLVPRQSGGTEFPLYGLPFDRLTEVTDERGQAVMSWAYTDGTLHVIRYPLPKPR